MGMKIVSAWLTPSGDLIKPRIQVTETPPVVPVTWRSALSELCWRKLVFSTVIGLGSWVLGTNCQSGRFYGFSIAFLSSLCFVTRILAIFVLEGTAFNVGSCSDILPAKMNNQSGLTEAKTKAWRPLFTGHLHRLDSWNLAGSALIFSPVSFLPQRKKERCSFYNCSLEHSVYF